MLLKLRRLDSGIYGREVVDLGRDQGAKAVALGLNSTRSDLTRDVCEGVIVDVAAKAEVVCS
jgi:hypothetical protein